MEERNGRDNLKEVWKFYVLALGGLGLIWLGRQLDGTLSSICMVAGAVSFFIGLLLTLNWDRKRKKADKEAGIEPYER